MGLLKKFLDSRFTKKILETEDSPERIARGVAVGSFIAVTPTVGLQVCFALLAATIARGNRLAAVAMTFVLNPFIIVPPSYWYFPAYYLGAFLLGMEPVGFARVAQAYESSKGIFQLLGNLWSLGIDVYGPMLLGGAIIGVPVAFLMRHISLHIISRHRAKSLQQEKAEDTDEKGHGPDNAGAGLGGNDLP